MTPNTTAWPDAVFDAPLLRGLDAQARATLHAAGRLVRASEGDVLFEEGQQADTLFVVVQGTVALRTIRRGDEHATVVRTASAGDTFGEEASLGLARRTQAVAQCNATLAEIPAALFRRGAGRSMATSLADREERFLRRSATADLLRTIMLTRDLSADDLDLVLDAVVHEDHPRGGRIVEAGTHAADVCLIADGLVQLQDQQSDAIAVVAYLSRGDAFGDEEALGGQPRATTAVAMGPCRILRLPAAVLRTLADRNPGLLSRIRRLAQARIEVQAQVVGAAAARSTQHVFKDLYRMQMARSLLVIDQDTCVRCGHCAWTCAEVHDGVSRLVRRGDKVVTRLAQHGEGPRSLLLPNSCQHCKNPACMIDCPTGAIGRDLGGEVFIRPELCTGCGNCAKACPWENIQMAPRPRTVAASAGTVAVPTSKMSEDLAVKCDLCRAWDGPACVQACPTASIFRLDPTRDVAEVAALLAEPAAGGPRAKPSRGSHVTVCVGIVALGLGVLAWRMQAAGLWRPGAGVGLAAGWSAAVVMLLLVAHALPKRWPRLWLRERVRASAVRRAVEAETPPVSPRSKMRPLVVVHVGLGLGAMVAVVAHAGSRVSLSVGGLLHLSFWTVAGLGLLGTCVYRYGPRALGRLEREGMLPEDFAGHREALTDRLYRDLSGRSELCKTIAARVAVPYSRSVLGPLRLLLSRRSLAAEERRLRASIETMLQGRGHDKLEGLGELVRTVVELRALPVRAALTGMLRGWLPLHMLLTGVLGVLLLAHVVTMGGRP